MCLVLQTPNRDRVEGLPTVREVDREVVDSPLAQAEVQGVERIGLGKKVVVLEAERTTLYALFGPGLQQYSGGHP